MNLEGEAREEDEWYLSAEQHGVVLPEDVERKEMRKKRKKKKIRVERRREENEGANEEYRHWI